MRSPILGSAYVARSINAADNRLVNLFPEAIPDGGKEAGFLNRAPGLQFLQTVGTGPIRGLWAHQTNGSDFYVVSGSQVFRLAATNGNARTDWHGVGYWPGVHRGQRRSDLLCLQRPKLHLF